MNLPDALRSPKPLRWSTGRGTDVGALFEACVAGDLPTVRRLLDQDPSLARTHFDYRTPIYFAVREDRLEIAALLLDRGADPLSLAVDDALLRIAQDRGYRAMERLLRETLAHRWGASQAGTAVAEAIRNRDGNQTRRLLEASPELLHQGDERTNQPIHWAVMTRQPEIIDMLLDLGADIDARRHDGARPIHLTNGDYHYRGWRDVPASVTSTPDEVYRHLVRRGAVVDLGMAAAQGDLARVREILDRDPAAVNRVSEYGSYYLGCGAPLKNAAATGRLDIVRLMLARGADPNLPEEGIAPDGHALYSAVANGHYEIVRLLLEHGAHPNPEVESSADALSRAISRKDRPMIDLLCSHGAHRRPHLLAHDDDLQTAAAVFAADPSLADDPEALGSASSGAFVRLMLRHRPDLPKRVTVAKDPETTERLFRHGMDPSRPNWLGVTPLHEFARQGHLPNAAQFLRHGADLHVRDEVLRSTPLGYAAKFGRRAMVEFLLRQGARVRLPDDPPWATPRAWAERRGHRAIADLLRHHERWGGSPLATSLAALESLAADWKEATATGNAEAIRRLADHFGWDRSPNPDMLRDESARLLGLPTISEVLDDTRARECLARRLGFDTWREASAYGEAQARVGRKLAARIAAEDACLRGDDTALAERWAEAPDVFDPSTPSLSVRDRARHLIVREHHFATWDDFVRHREARQDPTTEIARFESAVEAVVDGDLPALSRMLEARKDLVRMRSDRVHRATLLHYVGANGVENFRQGTPSTAVEIAELLLRTGAEVDAVAGMYGGATTLGLVATSIHPALAGVQEELLQALLNHGARLDHETAGGNRQSAVNGCLANGRQAAAEFLASRGATLDLEGAAGVGRLDIVRGFFDDAGHRVGGATEAQLHSGFQWACEYGRSDVVRFLIERGIDTNRIHRGQTGLHWAAHAGHPAIVRDLLEHGASVHTEDANWQATPLGWAVHGWCHPPLGTRLDRYPEVVERLVAAGSRVRSEWLEEPLLRRDRAMAAALRG